MAEIDLTTKMLTTTEYRRTSKNLLDK